MRRLPRSIVRSAAAIIVAAVIFAIWFTGQEAAHAQLTAGLAPDGAQAALPPAFPSVSHIGDLFPHGR